jgi:cell division septation protein DedD
MSSQDTEITLSTAKMLALFFGLVALCAVFFGLGFSLGRGAARSTMAADQPSTQGTAPTLRPSAMKSGGAQAQPGEGMTFYKAVEQKDANPQLSASDSNPAPTKDAAKDATDPSKPPDPMTIAAGSGYFVQVAAVSKPDDAQALVDALKKKQYAAFTSNASSSDKFFHVQVGPFGDIKDAEATKAKLISDGYNPILKK